MDDNIKKDNNSNKNPLNALTNKKLRYGTFSTLTAMFVIAVLVVVNLIATQFDITFDMTKDKMFSISDKTKNIIKDLPEDVTVYALFQTGGEISYYTEVLDQYSANSSNVNVVYKDPYLYPTFVNAYQNENGDEIATGSIIVESSTRYKVIAPDDLITYEIDYNTFTEYVSTINIEPRVTNAIEYVLQAETPKIYALEGHGEVVMDNSLLKTIDDKNFSYNTVDLLTLESVPEDCEALIITTPQRDYSDDETAKLMTYLQKGGKALFVIGSTNFGHPNLDSILSAYGLQLEYMAILETDPNYLYSQAMPQYFFPHTQVHDITQTIIDKKLPAFVVIPQNIALLDVVKNSITIEKLLTTSSGAYGKINPQAQSANKEADDASGPFNLAVAVTDSMYIGGNSIKTQLVVSSAEALLDPTMDNAVRGGNSEFLISALNWLIERTDSSTYIAPKSYQTAESLVITAADASNIKILSMGVIPGAIAITGIAVWFRRRHK